MRRDWIERERRRGFERAPYDAQFGSAPGRRGGFRGADFPPPRRPLSNPYQPRYRGPRRGELLAGGRMDPYELHRPYDAWQIDHERPIGRRPR